MIACAIECECLFAVAKTNQPKAGQANPLREFVATLLAIDGPVDVNEAAAAFQIRINIGRALFVPVAVLEEHDDVGLFELFCARPLRSG